MSPAYFLFYTCINTRILPLIEAIVAEATGQSMPENKISNIRAKFVLHLHPGHTVHVYLAISKWGDTIDLYRLYIKLKMNHLFKKKIKSSNSFLHF